MATNTIGTCIRAALEKLVDRCTKLTDYMYMYVPLVF